MQVRGGQLAVRRAASAICSRPLVASHCRSYSSFVPKDSKKAKFNPLLPTRYTPEKKPPQPKHKHPPLPNPALKQNTVPVEDNTAHTNYHNKSEDVITTKQENTVPEDITIIQEPPEILEGISFEDKDDLEPSICQYMFSLNIQYVKTLDFGDQNYFDQLDMSKQPKHARLVALVSPADENVNMGGNLFPPSIVGYIKNYDEGSMDPNSSVLNAENFVLNPLFYDFFIKAIAKHAARDPDLCEYARTATNTFVPVWDYRSPLEDGMIERENIIGAVTVDDGKIVDGELVANEGYKLYDDNFGWCSLSRFMFQKVYQELVDLAKKGRKK